MTLNEIIETIDKNYGWDKFTSELLSEELDDPKLGFTFSFVKQLEDYNSDGCVISYIFKLDDKLYRITANYNSWSGAEINGDFCRVEPVEVTKIVYRKVK